MRRHKEEFNGWRAYFVTLRPQIASICELYLSSDLPNRSITNKALKLSFGQWRRSRRSNGFVFPAYRGTLGFLVFPAFRGTLGIQCSQPFVGLLAYNVPSLSWDSWLSVELFNSMLVEWQSLLQLEDSIGQLPCDGSRITES